MKTVTQNKMVSVHCISVPCLESYGNCRCIRRLMDGAWCRLAAVMMRITGRFRSLACGDCLA